MEIGLDRLTSTTAPKAMTAAEFKQWQEDLGLSITKTAKVLDLSPRAVSYYRSGGRPIPKTLEIACGTLTKNKVKALLKPR